jgi:hypothetical protein
VREIIHHIGRWEQRAHILELLNAPSVRRATVALYVKVLGFLVSSTLWLSRPKVLRLGVSFLTAKGDKFEAKLKDMKAASDLIDKEIQTRATQKNLTSLTSIDTQMNHVRIDVKGTINKIDQATQQLKLLAGESILKR